MWSDTAVAYTTFYHLLAKGEYITTAVEGMCIASGNKSFWSKTAEESRQSYLEYIKSIKTEDVQQRLESNAQEESPRNTEMIKKMSRQEKRF